jgi:hypothetical protein
VSRRFRNSISAIGDLEFEDYHLVSPLKFKNIHVYEFTYTTVFPHCFFGIYLITERICGGTRERSWLRHYAKTRKVVGSIHDKVIALFQFT